MTIDDCLRLGQSLSVSGPLQPGEHREIVIFKGCSVPATASIVWDETGAFPSAVELAALCEPRMPKPRAMAVSRRIFEMATGLRTGTNATLSVALAGAIDGHGVSTVRDEAGRLVVRINGQRFNGFRAVGMEASLASGPLTRNRKQRRRAKALAR